MPRPDIDVRLVETIDDIADFMVWLDDNIARREVLAIDTETTGLEWWTYAFTRLWQVGDGMSGWAVPTEWWGQVIIAAMRKIVDSNTTVVFHNAAFDMHAMETMGWPVPHWSNVHDTKFLLHLRDSAGDKRLKGKQTAQLLGHWVYDGKRELTEEAKRLGFKTVGKNQNMWRRIPVQTTAYWAYGILDTVLTRMLFDALEPVRVQFAEAYTRELRYQQIMYRAERRGVRLDVGYTEQLRERLITVEQNELHYLQSQGLANPNSNKQLVALLETDYSFVPWEFTESGNPSVNKGVLALLAQAGGLQESVVVSLIQYKRARKWRTTYCDTFLEKLDDHGFVHPSINTMAARTGRSSIQGPALQTLPSGDAMIRKCMLPNVGDEWYSIDYSNQEPRTLAHYGQSPKLISYFRDGDGTGSVHDFVAGQMFGDDYTKEQRSLAKVFGLSRSYGAGATSMAAASGLSVAEVEHVLPMYDDLMGLENLKQGIFDANQHRGKRPYVVVKGGQRVYADEDKEFTLVNFLCQGTGAVMMKEAINRVDDIGLADHCLFTMHDEGCYSIPKGSPEIARQIAEAMVDHSYAVPMPVDIDGPGASWGALYDN